MNILIVNDARIPVLKYGGTERIVWWLGKALTKMGHRVTYLVKKGSICDFADIIPYNPDIDLDIQVPYDMDVVHINFPIKHPLKKPYIVTIHGNGRPGEKYDLNTVFVSENHALRHGSEIFVYNGLDFDDYGRPDFNIKRDYMLFLAKARLRVKNVRGAKAIARGAGEKIVILGGYGISFNGRIIYKGFKGGERKNKILNKAKALLFPVLWHEPFGLALIESLYFGVPVLGTEYGSLPEIIISEVGFLSNNKKELIAAAKNIEAFDRKKCSEYAISRFSSRKMAEEYLKLYERVLNGEKLNAQEPAAQLTWKQELLPLYE